MGTLLGVIVEGNGEGNNDAMLLAENFKNAVEYNCADNSCSADYMVITNQHHNNRFLILNNRCAENILLEKLKTAAQQTGVDGFKVKPFEKGWAVLTGLNYDDLPTPEEPEPLSSALSPKHDGTNDGSQYEPLPQ